MADNVAITPGTGATVAADDVGGVLYQRVKIAVGADGSATDLAHGSAAAASSLPVTASTEDIARVGIITETAPASDTASSGLNGRAQRIAQNQTTAMARAVAQLGARTIAQSPAVNLATDDLLVASVGAAADAAATAGSTGTVQGKLRTLTAQLSTGLVAQLGARTIAQSPAVNIATDDAIHGALTETAPASDTASSGLNGRLQRIAQRITSLIALLPTALGQGTMAQSLKVAIASDQSGLPLTSQGYDVAVTITRPANQTPYTANDNVGGALSFATIGPSAGAIMITGAQLELDIGSIPSGMTSFRLHLYNVTPPSAVADNGAWDLPSGDRSSYLGYIDLGTPADLGSTLYIEVANLNKQVRLSGTGLFGYLVTTAGYTPAANSEVYKVTLHTVAV